MIVFYTRIILVLVTLFNLKAVASLVSDFKFHDEFVDFGELDESLLHEKLGFIKRESLFGSSTFSLCLSENDCDYVLKIINTEDKVNFKESLEINGRASSSGLALPIYAAGRFKTKAWLGISFLGGGEEKFFIVMPKGKPLKNCSSNFEERNRVFFVNELLKIDVTHGDLEAHFNNFICFDDKVYLIDFDLGRDLSRMESQERDFWLSLEKFCTLSRDIDKSVLKDKDKVLLEKIESVSKEEDFEPGLLTGMRSALPICLCRKAIKDKAISDYIITNIYEDFDCSYPYMKESFSINDEL